MTPAEIARLRTVLAEATRTVEAATVEAIAAWLDQVSSDFVNSSRRQATEEAAQMIREGAWRPK